MKEIKEEIDKVFDIRKWTWIEERKNKDELYEIYHHYFSEEEVGILICCYNDEMNGIKLLIPQYTVTILAKFYREYMNVFLDFFKISYHEEIDLQIFLIKENSELVKFATKKSFNAILKKERFGYNDLLSPVLFLPLGCDLNLQPEKVNPSIIYGNYEELPTWKRCEGRCYLFNECSRTKWEMLKAK